MRCGGRIGGLLFHPPLYLSRPSRRLLRTESPSAISPEDLLFLRKGNLEILPWLQQKSGQEISSMFSIGSSIYGRSLFATRSIHAGECMLKVPYSVHITRDEVPSEVEPLIGTNISNIAWLALVLLAERRRGQDSEWAPYISSLPRIHDMHCSIFWTNNELEMIRPSIAYEETLHQRICIEKDFLAIKPALEHFPEMFGDVSLEDFMHAYALVGSRAWGTSKGLSLAVLVNDEDKEISEVLADRDYAVGEQVLIRYGKFPNATLLLDFGFTLPNNVHEQVQISVDVPLDDSLHITKMELFHKHCMPAVGNILALNSSRGSFTINCWSPEALFHMLLNNLGEDKWQEISLLVNSAF